MKKTLLITLLLLCSALLFSQTENSEDLDSNDSTGQAQETDIITSPSVDDDNYATLIIYRPTNEFRSNKFFIFFGSEIVSLIKAKTYQQFRIPVGKITILIKSQNWEVIQGDVEKGKTYNILLKLYRGFHFAIAVPEFVSLDDQRIAEIQKKQGPVLPKRKEVDDARKKYTEDARLIIEKVENETAKIRELVAAD